MLCAYGALLDVICNVGFDAGLIDCFSDLWLHLFHPLVGSLEVSKGTVEEL